MAVATCDNSFKLFINGKEVTSNSDYNKPKLVDIRSHLVKGRNLFAVQGVNAAAKSDDKSTDQSNPAGLILYARIRQTTNGKPEEKVMDFATDKTWLWSTTKADGWEKPEFDASGWQSAAELGNVDMACSKAIFLRTFSKSVTLLAADDQPVDEQLCRELANAGVRLPPARAAGFEHRDRRWRVCSNGAQNR